jgi:hypothetical protein
MAAPVDRERLKIELASSREGTAAYVAAVRHDLDMGAKVKRSVRNNPLAWYAAAGLLGLLLSRIPPARRKVVVKGPKLRSDAQQAGKAAIGVTLLKFALDFAKPALLRWFQDRFHAGARPARTAKV